MLQTFLFICWFIRLSGQILLSRYLMNNLSNLDETYSEYSLAPIDDWVRFWRSKVKHQGHSRPLRWRRHPSSRLISTHADLWIYRLLFVILFVCVFLPLRISPPRTKFAASNFARWFVGVQGTESPILGNVALPEARHRPANRPAHALI